MPPARPSYVDSELWCIATQPSPDPCVVIFHDGYRVVCDRTDGVYVSFPATDPNDTSGLKVIVAGKPQQIPWTKVAMVFRPKRPLTSELQAQVDTRLRPHFSDVDKWINNYIEQTKPRAKRVIDFPTFDLSKAFRRATLEKAYAVEEAVVARIPLTAMGLVEFQEFERMSGAITYKDTFFVPWGSLTASLA